MLPPAYCIYCRELPERRRVAEAHLAERGVPVRWWRGFHGRSFGLETLLQYHPEYRMPPGHVGVLLSHYSLWLHLETAGLAESLIFEDDVVLCEAFAARFAEARAALPDDWQFVYVGWIDRPELPRIAINDLVCEVTYPFGTHAYLVRASALPVLLNTMAEARAHVDIQLFENALPMLRTYCVTTSLAQQRTFTGEWATSAGIPD